MDRGELCAVLVLKPAFWSSRALSFGSLSLLKALTLKKSVCLIGTVTGTSVELFMLWFCEHTENRAILMSTLTCND